MHLFEQRFQMTGLTMITSMITRESYRGTSRKCGGSVPGFGCELDLSTKMWLVCGGGGRGSATIVILRQWRQRAHVAR